MGQVPVFIVEDSPHMESALRALLATCGPFEVTGSARSESEATDWLLSQKSGWRLAILDLVLADGSGFGLVQRCRKVDGTGKIVVFSEFATPAVKARCLELGADAAFMKSEMKSFIRFLVQTGVAA